MSTTITNETFLPEYRDLTVPELKLSTPALKAGAYHLGLFCDWNSKEFMLCRNETRDPRKCLKEGLELTNCGIKFYQQLKKHCRPEFENLVYCMDHKSGRDIDLRYCKHQQRPYDDCMYRTMQLKRPEVGYFSRVRVHQSERPEADYKPYRDYTAEAAKVVAECPDDLDLSKREWRRYVDHQILEGNANVLVSDTMSIFHDEVEIEDFEYDEENEVYHYPCPCGDRFEVTKEQLENGEDVATCPSCSLIVRVIYDPEMFGKTQTVTIPVASSVAKTS